MRIEIKPQKQKTTGTPIYKGIPAVSLIIKYVR